MKPNFTLTRNQFGHLTLTTADGQVYEDVAPVRAFPIQAPQEGISLVCPDGLEAGWIERLDELSGEIRELIEGELEGREFMPHVRTIRSVTSFATPCTWSVETDRGDTEFVLRGEEDIRRIGRNMLLIADNHGINYFVSDILAMDKHSRKILDRFL
ncbi:MAG: DUF1854 domain-containing protein [Burkholderiaceae bacterium]|nr:DUF1854 domain-containing protein [Burkholderiaceae bacterium]